MVSNKVQQFLNSWKEGVIAIGKVYVNGGDYKKICTRIYIIALCF